MTVVTLASVGVSFGDRDVLRNINLTLDDRCRIALTGANGSGKTTLLRLIAGLSTPDSGRVTRSRGCEVGYLPQSGLVHCGRTLYEEAEQSFATLHATVAQHKTVAEQLASTVPGPEQQQLLEQLQSLQEKIERSDYYRREEQIDAVLTGLGFSRDHFGRPVEEFSSGWQMRIALAKTLLAGPDLVLLDEPTNYLDLEAREWLEGFLNGYRGGFILVSHDRYFLDTTVSEIFELFLGDLKRYRGNYSQYERQRAAELADLSKRYEEQQAQIARTEEFIRRFRYNASKAQMVQSRIRQLEKLERIEVPDAMKRIHFEFPRPQRSGDDALRLQNVTRRYGDTPVLGGVSFLVSRGQKMAVVGPNGAGKSTLLRILAGVDRDYEGDVRYGTRVSTSYFSEEISTQLEPGTSILRTVEAAAESYMLPAVRDLLGAFLFRGDDVHKEIGVLSGGETSRVSLLRMLVRPANLLILDEPTNHLDMHSKDVLLDALQGFAGTVVFVSHDRHFLDRLADRVIEIARPDDHDFSVVTDYPGDYEYYRRRINAAAEARTGAAPSAAAADLPTGHRFKGDSTSPPDGPQSAPHQSANGRDNRDSGSGSSGARDWELRKARKNRLRAIEREEERLMERIEQLESRCANLQHKMALPENYRDGERVQSLQAELQQAQVTQQQVTAQWEELEDQRLQLEEAQ